MSLGGLLTVIDDDPQLREVVARAESDTRAAADSGPGAVTLAGEGPAGW